MNWIMFQSLCFSRYRWGEYYYKKYNNMGSPDADDDRPTGPPSNWPRQHVRGTFIRGTAQSGCFWPGPDLRDGVGSAVRSRGPTGALPPLPRLLSGSSSPVRRSSPAEIRRRARSRGRPRRREPLGMGGKRISLLTVPLAGLLVLSFISLRSLQSPPQYRVDVSSGSYQVSCAFVPWIPWILRQPSPSLRI